MSGVVIDIDRYANARSRLRRSETARPPRYMPIALSVALWPADAWRPVIDAEVRARVGMVRDEDLPPFIREKLASRAR